MSPPGFNLSAWALDHRTLVLFLAIACTLAGSVAYLRLGRAEDPPFTFKVMTIRSEWPGATAREVARLLTDRIEETLEEVPYYDYVRSYSKPGESVVFLNLEHSTPPEAVPESWYQARKKIGDMAGTLPAGVKGPYFNDEFGDVYAAIYAFTGEDFTPAELKRIAEEARERLLQLEGVGKVDLIGTQDERIWIEVSTRRLAQYGVPVERVIQALARENAVAEAGHVDSGPDRVFVRVDVGLDQVAVIRETPLIVDGRQLTVGDVAKVYRGFVDPQRYTMRTGGRDAIGLGVVMAQGANALDLGEALAGAMRGFRAELPAGVEVEQVADQARVVRDSVGDFFKSFAEALAIVMVVSFVSLGWRTGIVVALAVPLTLAITLVGMAALGVDLHRISLGALIISLGLLVDDAIIAVEMMVVKLEQGLDRLDAGAYAWTSTAMPMLSGTIVTAAGFLPVGFAASTVGEYTNAIFWVVALSLMISWLVAVLFTPYLGYLLLPRSRPHPPGHDVYDTRLYRAWAGVVQACVRARWLVISATIAAFAAALFGFGLVQQQFFPSASRPELLVDLRLREGASFAQSVTQVERMETRLDGDPDVARVVAYVGGGSPRFYLPLDQQLENANFSQLVVTAADLEARERLRSRLIALAETEFPAARVRIARLENGPPVGYPVQFRVMGTDPERVRELARAARDALRAEPRLIDPHLDWDERVKRIRVEVDMAKARVLGVTKAELARSLEMALSGRTVTQFREGTELIDVVLRAPPEERVHLDELGDLALRTESGGVVPLRQVGTLRYELEDGVVWRRDRLTTITVRGDVVDGVQAPDVSAAALPLLEPVRAALPDGYRLEVGGAVEESAKGQAAINAVLPMMVLVMVTALMVQLQSFSRVLLVLLTAPLGLIGVTAALLVTGMPFGFVAMLGVIALAGIIMRNAVILVDQIDRDVAAGKTRFAAIVDATVRRTRPILLTAAAAILAMIPLTHNVFWAPMAVAMMGGLAGATVLTLLFLPALYAAWLHVPRTEETSTAAVRRRSGAAMPLPAE